MAHEITIRADGFAEAAFSLQPAWHGLGTVFDHEMTSTEALSAAGLDWRVVQRPLAMGVPKVIQTPEGQVDSWQYQELDGFFANVRDDNDLFLGAVSDQYQVVQNVEAFQFLDELVDEHQMRYEAAFSLRGGRKVVMLAKMPGFEDVADGDAVLPYVVLSLTHDGTGAIRFGPCATRVVCANTYTIALSEGHTKEMSIRHTGKIKDKLSQARSILGISRDKFSEYADISRKLAQYELLTNDWLEFLDLMCPRLTEHDPDWTQRRADKIDETRDAITEAYHNERQTGEITETAWAAYNAVSEYIDHLPRRGATKQSKAEARFNVTLYGTGRDMKERAFQTACRFAGVELAA